MTPIIIIGSGIAGLACARRLVEVGLRPIIFDKGHNIGGRVATKHAHGLQFDHGAQYVNARGEAFATVLGGLVNAGFAASWSEKKSASVSWALQECLLWPKDYLQD
tara:strand:+ start:590 stop:907 length:318 start_codon:yes stop_codon:yes gene_type:complete